MNCDVVLVNSQEYLQTHTYQIFKSTSSRNSQQLSSFSLSSLNLMFHVFLAEASGEGAGVSFAQWYGRFGRRPTIWGEEMVIVRNDYYHHPVNHLPNFLQGGPCHQI